MNRTVFQRREHILVTREMYAGQLPTLLGRAIVSAAIFLPAQSLAVYQVFAKP